VPPRYQELDALRGIAAIIVMLFHYNMERTDANHVFRLGVTGVDLFFIISGFVIFMTISKVSSPLEFFINRFSRLYPTYWTCVTFTFLVQVTMALIFSHFAQISWWKYLTNMTMFQYYFRQQNLDGSYWTMIIEMLFYFFIAFLFKVRKLNYIIPVGLVILFTSIVNDVLISGYFPLADKINGAFPLYTHFPLFFAGIIFYKLMHAGNGFNEKLFYYFCLCICFAVKLLQFYKGGRSQFYIDFNEYAVVLSCYFIVFILFVHHKLGFIINRQTLFLGKISFALYLIHQYISIRVIMPNLIEYAHFGFWTSALVACSISMLLATAITYYIEVPLGKKMKYSLRSRLGLQNTMA